MQKFPGDYKEKLISFPGYVNDVQREYDFLIGQTGNTKETTFFLYIYQRPRLLVKKAIVRSACHYRQREVEDCSDVSVYH